MQQLPPTYLTEIARQMGFLSAFLGGVAATFMVQLLSVDTPGRPRGWAILLAAGSSIAFIVAVVATTSLAIVLDPNAPRNVAASLNVDRARLLSFLPFVLGIYLLLACIGLAGFLRSRRSGLATTIMAVIGAVLATTAIAG